MSKKKKLRIYKTGETEDKRDVYSGIFKFYDSLGFPLSMTYLILKNKNIQIDWFNFIENAKNNGWKKETTLSRIKDAINDCEDFKYWEKFEKKLIAVVKEIYD